MSSATLQEPATFITFRDLGSNVILEAVVRELLQRNTLLKLTVPVEHDLDLRGGGDRFSLVGRKHHDESFAVGSYVVVSDNSLSFCAEESLDRQWGGIAECKAG